MTIDLALAALAPPLLLTALLNLRGLRGGRPWWTVGLALLAGGLCAEAAGVLERVLTMRSWNISSFGMLMVFTTVVAGMVEELCKYAAFRLGPGRLGWFREEYDGVLYVGAVSLGFAAWENLGYVQEHGLSTAWLRAWTAIPLHAACGVVMGSYVGRARVRQLHGWSTRGLAGTGVLVAVLLHGLYDMFAFASSPVTAWALYITDAVAVIWAFRLARGARTRSAAFGGRDLGMPPASTRVVGATERVLPERDERISAMLGLLPGLGQAYNGEFRKAGLFALVMLVNVGLLAAVHAFVEDPGGSLTRLASWGMTLAVDQKELVSLLANGRTIESIMLGAVGAWAVYSGLDAWLTARRVARLEGVETSWLVHVTLVLLIVLVPFMIGGGGGGGNGDQDGQDKGDGKGGQVQVTWVDTPDSVTGWNPGSQGQGDGKGEKVAEKRSDPQGDGGKDERTEQGTEATEPSSFPQNGDVGIPQQQGKRRQTKAGQHEKPSDPKRSGDPAKTAEGTRKSYNDYLSARLHEGAHRIYFEGVPPTVWTVIHYHVAADGTLSDLYVIDTNGTPGQAQRAVESVRSLVPLAPLPGGVRGIDVNELFWQTGDCPIPPGTLADRLSRLPDGRQIEVEN